MCVSLRGRAGIVLPILLVIAGVALLVAARQSGLLSAASEVPETSSVPVLTPPRVPIVGLLDSAVTDVMELLGVVDEKTKRLAEAIAAAEGFGVAGAIPTVNHNPGDLKVPGSRLVNGHTFFETDEAGWSALYRQIGLMRSGKSTVYKPDFTFEQVARKYAEGWQNWLANVTRVLGVSPQSTLRQYFEG
jgi:hypothetical protein